jgi:hypothetical protein
MMLRVGAEGSRWCRWVESGVAEMELGAWATFYLTPTAVCAPRRYATGRRSPPPRSQLDATPSRSAINTREVRGGCYSSQLPPRTILEEFYGMVVIWRRESHTRAQTLSRGTDSCSLEVTMEGQPAGAGEVTRRMPRELHRLREDWDERRSCWAGLRAIAASFSHFVGKN